MFGFMLLLSVVLLPSMTSAQPPTRLELALQMTGRIRREAIALSANGKTADPRRPQASGDDS